MCQYELWIYTRCRSTTPPSSLPTLPTGLLQLLPPPIPPYTPSTWASRYENTYPHMNYYRVAKCRFAPDCLPPAMNQLSPAPPTATGYIRRLLPTSAALDKSQPNTTSPSPLTPIIPAEEIKPESGSALALELTATPSPNLTAVLPAPVVAVAPIPPMAPVRSPGQQQASPHSREAPIRIRHQYCHACAESLRESLDGEGMICFQSISSGLSSEGVEFWGSGGGFNKGRSGGIAREGEWFVDERAARGEIVVDLDCSSGLDWGRGMGVADRRVMPTAREEERPATLLPSPITTSRTPTTKTASNSTTPPHSPSSSKPSSTPSSSHSPVPARSLTPPHSPVSSPPSLQPLIGINTQLLQSQYHELQKRRRIRALAEHARRKRWKGGWDAWAGVGMGVGGSGAEKGYRVIQKAGGGR